MAEILQHAFSLPTTVFTVLLGLVIVYWFFAMLGIFNLEMLEGLGDAAGSLGDAVETIADATEGGGEGFFAKTGTGDVPRSITWSLTILFSWISSLAMSLTVPDYQAMVKKGFWLGAGFGAAAIVLAFGVTLVAIQPLRKVMVAGYGQKRSDLVGKACTVRTGRVDETFGQAEVDGGSALVQVRLRHAGENAFQRGSKALIDEYDSAREVFYITPYVNVPAGDGNAGSV